MTSLREIIKTISMSKTTNIIKATLIIMLVSGLLAFRLGQGKIYCFLNTDAPNVNRNLSCYDSQQPHSRKVDYEPSNNPADPNTNPCLSNETPFDGSIAGQCNPVNRVRATLP